MGGKSDAVLTVDLMCEHRQGFIQPVPKTGELVYCYRCCSYEMVVKAPATGYQWRCTQPLEEKRLPNGYVRDFYNTATSQERMEKDAEKHRRRYPHHPEIHLIAHGEIYKTI